VLPESTPKLVTSSATSGPEEAASEGTPGLGSETIIRPLRPARQTKVLSRPPSPLA
jgi:hypothetical protein